MPGDEEEGQRSSHRGGATANDISTDDLNLPGEQEDGIQLFLLGLPDGIRKEEGRN
jgi:hypothetical protein